jgi:hypothetical protein
MQRPVEVSTSIRSSFAQVREVLDVDPGAVFGDAATHRTHQDLSTRTELSVDLRAGASVHQQVLLELGRSRSTESGVSIPVSWRATGRERLFPIFTGELEASETATGSRLRLHGAYTVPLGVIGRVGNGVGGWRLAHRSVVGLLERLARRLEAEADGRRSAVAPEWDRSEIYIG